MDLKFLKLTDKLTMVDENHLGGFIIENDPATFTPGLWRWICGKYKIKSVVDIGCGMGYSIKEFLNHCSDVVGLDGSDYIQENSEWKDLIEKVDFANKKYVPDRTYDLAWSSEFLEHVEEQYIPNYIEVFNNSKYAAVTHAGPGQGGHHHVNCQPSEYWIKVFEDNGFEFLEEDTEELKRIAYADGLKYNPEYKDNHFFLRGLFFRNKRFS